MPAHTPDEKLAALIIEKLRAQQLLPAQRLAELAEPLAQGAVRAEDWRSLSEAALLNDKKNPPESQYE